MRGDQTRRLAPLAGALGFAVVAAAAAARLWRLRYFSVWIDESDNVVVGWLISEGQRLYGTLFSHHLPLAYMVAHAVAVLSPSDDLAHFRLVPILAYVLAALCFIGSPIAERSLDRGWCGAAFFVAASSGLVPLWSGFMLVTDVLWGCAFVGCAALLWLPLALGVAPGRMRSAAGGVALGLWLSGSLVTVYPLAVLGALLGALALASPRHRAALRETLGAAALGAAAVALVEGLWTWRYGDLAGFIEEAIRFNFRFYGPSQGYAPGVDGTAGVVARGLADTGRIWLADLSAPRLRSPETWFAWLALAASVGLGLQIAAGLPTHGRVRRTGAALATIGALLLLAATLRLRGAGFHAAPYYLWILGAVAACVAGAAGVRSAQIGAALFVVGGVLISPIRGPLLFAWDEPDLRRTLAAMLPTFEYVRDHTTPDQRFLSLNVEPIAYLIARRQPAMPGVFYLPWQAEWERSRREPDSCARVRAAPPPYVYFKPHRVHGRPWESYGSCFDALLLERYERVTDLTTRDLWRLRTEPHSGSSRKATSPPAGGRDEDRG